MPIYEYKCEACDHRLEALQKISDHPLRECPECQEPTLKRLISPVAFRLKGTGWYETDFKSGNRRNVLESEGGAKSDGAGDKPAAKETKSDKADAKPAKADASTAT